MRPFYLTQKVLAQKVLALRSDCSGQDLIEYALLAAAIAIAVGAILPQDLMPAVSTIFSKVASCMTRTP
jgi:Flp pilus assembly pilin Flp